MARSADANTFDAYDEAPTHTVTSSGITTTGTPIYAWRATRLGNITVFKITVGVSGGTNAFTGHDLRDAAGRAQPVAGGVAHATTSAVDGRDLLHRRHQWPGACRPGRPATRR